MRRLPVDEKQTGNATSLRAIIGLTECLSEAELEHIVIAAIRKHRSLRDTAEDCEQAWHALQSSVSATGTTDGTRIAYVEAMIAMHAQQAVLSALLDILGYIPEVPVADE